jgi:tripartite-type tricarboxylate transporter receptor subunit TctC
MRIAILVASLLYAGIAHAQNYPARSVKVIVPWPPGQAADIVTRIVAEKLQGALGQPFVIDNKPGAAGTIGRSQSSTARRTVIRCSPHRAARSRSCLSCKSFPTTRWSTLRP